MYPSHATRPVPELKEMLRRGSPSSRQCLNPECQRWVWLQPDRSWCDACEAKFEARMALRIAPR